jgi:hypothetical protein
LQKLFRAHGWFIQLEGYRKFSQRNIFIFKESRTGTFSWASTNTSTAEKRQDLGDLNLLPGPNPICVADTKKKR